MQLLIQDLRNEPLANGRQQLPLSRYRHSDIVGGRKRESAATLGSSKARRCSVGRIDARLRLCACTVKPLMCYVQWA